MLTRCKADGCTEQVEKDELWCFDHKPLDEFHWHEAMHMASAFAEMVERHLLEHRAVQSCDEVKELVETAVDALADAYQVLGRKKFENFDAK